MKIAVWTLCAAGCFPVVAQTPARLAGTPEIRLEQVLHEPEAILSAVSTTHDGGVFHLKGRVEIRTDTILLKADEASYNHETGEMDAHGEVKVTPGGPIIDHGLSRFGIK